MKSALRSIVIAASLFVSVVGTAYAKELKADALLAVDRTRGAMIEQIITQFKGNFAPGQEQVVRETLRSLRADFLLSASLAPSLDGLVAVLKSADTGVDASAIKPKVLGDPTEDLVYTPRTPCRLFDTRVSQGGQGPLAPGATRTYSATVPVAQQGGPGGCVAPAGTAVAMIQLVALSPTGPGLLQGGANGTGPFANALMLYQPGDAHGASIPMPVVVANGRFDLVAQVSGAEVAGDLLGYFAEPEATPLQCTSVSASGAAGTIPSGDLVQVDFPACPAGYTKTGVGCNVGFGTALKLFEVSPSAWNSCYWVNDSGASVDRTLYSAEAVCCRIPGR